MQSRVMCNSLCGVKVNIMEGRPLVAIGRKVTDRIHYSKTRPPCPRSGVLKIYIQRSKSEFSSVSKVRTGTIGYHKTCF